MIFAISGTNGLVGKHLAGYFRGAGHTVYSLVRGKTTPGPSQIVFPDGNSPVDPIYESLDVVIHLGGVNIASGRWSPELKQSIYSSRIDSTQSLALQLARLRNPPKCFICASAIGYYGSEPVGAYTEDSAAGRGFLADVCIAWEKACDPARQRGIRVVNLRFGPVLTTEGGMLAKLLPVFSLGLGGPVGSGKQVISWLALDEIPLIVAFLLDHPEISGAFNAVAPNPVTNEEFSKILAQVLHRPCFFRTPAFAVRFLLGEMGQEMLLNGAYVLPSKLLKAGYQFMKPDLNQFLTGILSGNRIIDGSKAD